MMIAAHDTRDEPAAWAELPCPTCWIGPSDHASAAVGRFGDEYGYDVAPATCPTCGVASVEWGLVAAMDAVLHEILGLARLEQAVCGRGEDDR